MYEVLAVVWPDVAENEPKSSTFKFIRFLVIWNILSSVFFLQVVVEKKADFVVHLIYICSTTMHPHPTPFTNAPKIILFD